MKVAIVSPIGSLVSGRGTWPWFLGFALFGAIAPRIHLRVSSGRVILVRTVAWVAWRLARCRPLYGEDVTRIDFDGHYLVAPTRKGQSDVEAKTIVLSASEHGLEERTITDIAKAAQTALGPVPPRRF